MEPEALKKGEGDCRDHSLIQQLLLKILHFF
jgi:hypothetical protein